MAIVRVADENELMLSIVGPTGPTGGSLGVVGPTGASGPTGAGAALSGTGINAAVAGANGFWSDIDGSASIWRFTTRMFIGGAVAQDNTRIGAQPSPGFIPSAAAGANWAIRDAQFGVQATRGNLALVGMSRSIDGDGTASAPAAIGVGGFAIGNSLLGHSCWGLYSDVQYESGPFAYGCEFAIKNKGANFASTPDFLVGGTIGSQFGTGDDSYGGVHTNPNNVAQLVVRGPNGNTWNSALVVGNNAMTVDAFGRGRPIRLGKLHHISWYDGNNNEAFYITSGVVSPGKGASQLVLDNLIVWQNQNGNPIFRVINDGFVTANSAEFHNAVAGSAPRIVAFGTDANIDLEMTPKGTGIFKVGAPTRVLPGTFAALPSSPLEGTIAAITDSNVAGNGATVSAGGGTNHVLAYHNGTAWKVIV